MDEPRIAYMSRGVSSTIKQSKCTRCKVAFCDSRCLFTGAPIDEYGGSLSSEDTASSASSADSSSYINAEVDVTVTLVAPSRCALVYRPGESGFAYRVNHRKGTIERWAISANGLPYRNLGVCMNVSTEGYLCGVAMEPSPSGFVYTLHHNENQQLVLNRWLYYPERSADDLGAPRVHGVFEHSKTLWTLNECHNKPAPLLCVLQGSTILFVGTPDQRTHTIKEVDPLYITKNGELRSSPSKDSKTEPLYPSQRSDCLHGKILRFAVNSTTNEIGPVQGNMKNNPTELIYAMGAIHPVVGDLTPSGGLIVWDSRKKSKGLNKRDTLLQRHAIPFILDRPGMNLGGGVIAGVDREIKSRGIASYVVRGMHAIELNTRGSAVKQHIDLIDDTFAKTVARGRGE